MGLGWCSSRALNLEVSLFYYTPILIVHTGRLHGEKLKILGWSMALGVVGVYDPLRFCKRSGRSMEKNLHALSVLLKLLQCAHGYVL